MQSFHIDRIKSAYRHVEIASALSLSWACVSDLVSLLIEQNLLFEFKRVSQQGESVGRTPTYLSLNPDKYFLGIDINDSGFSVTNLGVDGRKTDYKKWVPETFCTTDELAASVCDKISVMLRDADNCLGVGVAMQGARANDGGWYYPIMDKYESFDPRSVIRNRFDLPVFARHDPECMLYAVIDNIAVDSMTLRVDNDIGVAAMKNGRILDVPLDLGHIYVGEKKLKTILNDGDATGDYSKIACELGMASANLAKLLGLKKVFIVGGILKWFDKVENYFENTFRRVSKNIEYIVCDAQDAPEGAARVAMAEYPIIKEV